MVSVSSRPTITSSQASRPRCSVPLRYRLDSLGFYAVFRMIISLCIGTRVGFSLDWSEARERERRRLVLMVGAHSDQLRNNVTLGQFRVDVDIAHMSAFDGELAAAIQEAPREFLPAVRTRERASERFTRERSNTRRSSSKLLVKNVARWVSLRKSKSMDSLLAVRPMKTRTMSSSTQYLRSKYSSVIVLHDLCQYVRLAYVHSTLSKLLPGGRRSPLFDVAKVYKT